jgi:hypothetical protein
MPKFRVIEGTVWEIEAGTLEAAREVYEAHFRGDDIALYSMREVEGSSYWYGDQYAEGMCDALSYLSELFEGVQETDLWAEYMEEAE